MDARRCARLGVDCPVTFAGDRAGVGLLINLSASGCCVDHASIALDPQTPLTVGLRLRFGDTPVMVDAAVVRWRVGRQFGVEFLSMSSAARVRLEQYLRSVSHNLVSTVAEGGPWR
jgi:hypothetical protein